MRGTIQLSLSFDHPLKYILNPVYLLRKKLTNKDLLLSMRKKHISTMKEKEKTTMFMADKERIISKFHHL